MELKMEKRSVEPVATAGAAKASRQVTKIYFSIFCSSVNSEVFACGSDTRK